MDQPHAADISLIDRILGLPPELRAIVLAAIIPSSLHLDYSSYCYARSERIREHVARRRTITRPPFENEQDAQIRLKYFDHVTSDIFHLCHHMINKRWHEAVSYFVNTVTIWNLGKVEELNDFLRISSRPEHKARQEAFLKSMKSLHNLRVNLKPSFMQVSQSSSHLQYLGKLPEDVKEELRPTIVGISLDDLVSLERPARERWADCMMTVAKMTRDAQSHTARRPPQLRISCSSDERRTGGGRAFLENLRQRRCADLSQWICTGHCRYQGELGEIIVRWSGGMSDRE